MKKWILIALGAVVAVPLVSFAWTAFFFAQRADYGWAPEIATPSFPDEHPRVLFDEGHHNASTAGFAGRYWPFARLLRADGYDLERSRGPFTASSLEGIRILVIANASGGGKPQMFGINLPFGSAGKRDAPAFTPDEVEAVRSWVEAGGSLLLIADHAPFGEAAAPLADALGVTMHKGFLEVPDEKSDPLLFSSENGRLGDHPILTGGATGDAITRVMTYTGQSLDGPPGSVELLRLPGTAVESVPDGEGAFQEQPAGRAQGLAFEPGRGRVVVLGEAAMVTAQVSERVPYGMNTGDNDNQRFVLNVMSWLARAL